MNKMLLTLSLVSVMALYADDAAAKKEQAPAKETAPVVKTDKFWQNSDFSQWTKFNKNPKWTLEIKDDMIPAFWILNKSTGKLSMETKADNPQDKYLKLTDCRIYQENKGTAKKYKVILDAKGTGSLKVYVNRYGRIKTFSGLKPETIFIMKPSADQWQTFKAEYTKHDASEILGVVLETTGEVSVDNMFVFPVEEGEAK